MRIKLGYFLAYQIALLVWCFKLHQHFFEFTPADQIGLAVTALLPLAILRLEVNFSSKVLWAFPVVLPLLLLPTISYLLNYFSDAWIVIYVVLLVCGSFILLSKPNWLALAGIGATIAVWVLPSSFLPNQAKYYDRLSETIRTRNGEIDIVTWKNDQWIYYNNALVISTADGHMHSETLVHTTLPFFNHPSVLLIGDDFGLTKKEISKYANQLVHLPFDKELANDRSSTNHLADTTSSILEYITSASMLFDVIIVDLPDPQHLAFQHYYEDFFYTQCLARLNSGGMLITNAGAYYGTEKHYQKIESTLARHGMNTQVLQALIPTLGHRAWVLGSRESFDLDELTLDVQTKWLTQDALQLLQAKGKAAYPF